MYRRLILVFPLLVLLPACGTSLDSTPLATGTSKPFARSTSGVETAVRAYFRNKFDWLDQDHSGDVTKEEAFAAGMHPEGFDETDANHDGMLTLQEFGPEYAVKALVEAIQQTAANEFKRLDRNADLFLSPQEMRDAVALPFQDCDSNRDGKVTRSEFEDRLAQKSAMLR